MRTYEVTGSKGKLCESDIIEAETEREAFAAFRKSHPSLVPEVAELLSARREDDDDEPYLWVGACETCESEIIHYDDYSSIGDGMYLCEKCTDHAELEEAKHGH